MEMALRARSPLCCSPKVVVRPTTAGFLQPIFPCNGHVRNRVVLCTVASADYPRRRPKRSAIPKTKVPTAKGFAPNPPAESPIKKKEQSEIDAVAVNTAPSAEVSSSKSTKTIAEELDSLPSTSGTEALKTVDGRDEVGVQEETEQIESFEIGTSGMEETDEESIVSANEVDYSSSGTEPVSIIHGHETTAIVKEVDISRTEILRQLSRSTLQVEESATPAHRGSKVAGDVAEVPLLNEKGTLRESKEMVSSETVGAAVEQFVQDDFPVPEDDLEVILEEQSAAIEHISDKGVVDTVLKVEEPFQKKVEMDPEALKRVLENLAEENVAMGNKLFVFPEVVKPDQFVGIYLNRSLSALANEPQILIKGAFNGWRWKIFTEKMQKTELKGDWWSCKLYVPREAFRIDFVFFNGDEIFENNGFKDFLIPVESSMDEVAFEEFLLEEKRKELERFAAEEAERERQAEEHRRREEEKAANEADKAQAKAEVEMRKERLRNGLALASTSLDNVWHIEPSFFRAGDKIKLYYNRSSRPLMHCIDIWLHGGYNNWIDGLSIAERLVRSDKKDGDWWFADVVVPEYAMVLDWVFADGPPGNATTYDNDGRKDFHAIVPRIKSEELFWFEEEQNIYGRLQRERKEREEEVRRKAERSARMKADMKERTMRAFLLSQKHIVYTEPLEVRAGESVTVLYNPSNTVLNGKPEVWFRCSFNRWTHRTGPLPPQRMIQSENGSHLKATVTVPLDAYMMDFVFSEREDGGIYYNRNEMDYHFPVSGAVSKEPPMHIVHIAVEMAPIAKVGGLGDVVTSLSRAVQDLGHNVDIILPKYDCMNLSNVKDMHFHNSFTWGGTEIKVWFGRVEGLPVYFLEPQNGMFWVGCVYGRNDESRFGFFCHSALEFLLQSGANPDIIHCHDWSSAPVAWLYKEHYTKYGLTNGRVIFTIHNLEFGGHHISKAMLHCDRATTVSDSYSKEVANNSAIRNHLPKFHGIRNGIDPDIWDPFNDRFIPLHYTSENVIEGKKAAKDALQQKLGLRRSDYPLLGIISRLTIQKGIHLIKHAIHRTLDRNGQVVLLGSAPDHRIQNEFVNLANQLHSSHGGQAKLVLTYDEPLSHLIYAGADFILVPSLFEPCGLTQLTAMRYGSIPVVRRTGGLYDTVFDVDNDGERAQAQGLETNGFSFDGADTAGVDYALNRAISAWYDSREWFNSLCKRVMEQDWSWNRPALDYLELYHAARK